MPGFSLFHPPIQRTTKQPIVDINGDVVTCLTWTPYDDHQLSNDTFHIFPKLPPELQMHVWRCAAESWIEDQKNREGKKPCALDSVAYARPIRIRMNLPGLPACFHACSLAREVTFDVFRELCAKENLKRVGSGPKTERFRNECRKTNLTVGRQSTTHVHKTDERGTQIAMPIATHAWTQLIDFRIEKKKPRKRSTERVVEEEELPMELEPE